MSKYEPRLVQHLLDKCLLSPSSGRKLGERMEPNKI